MATEKNKRKNGTAINTANLLILCRQRGMSVSQLAQRIGRSRQTVYHAVENPRRYSRAFALIETNLL